MTCWPANEGDKPVPEDQQRISMTTRTAAAADLAAITRIYNQGVEDRMATLDGDPKTESQVAAWLWGEADDRSATVIAESEKEILGWAACRPYSHRCAHAGVAELSVYVERTARGRGVGERLLAALEALALSHGVRKLVLFALPGNRAGRALYVKRHFREVGTFEEHGRLDGTLHDVLIMEKLLRP
jgi:L-amino acid N-acyltransferase YncA